MEDAVDVLILKDNTTTVEDYVTALHLVLRDQVCTIRDYSECMVG